MLSTTQKNKFGLEYTFTRKGCDLDMFFFHKEDNFVWYGVWLYDEIIKYNYPYFSFAKVACKEHTFNAPSSIMDLLLKMW